MVETNKKYYLNNSAFSQTDLLNHCNEMLKSEAVHWEEEIFSFILQWFDQNDFVYVNTSGSTGKPKQIKLLKKNMAASATATLNFLKLNKGDKALLCLPADYIAGKMMIVRSLTGGLNLHYIKPKLNLSYHSNEKFDLIAVVPSMLSNILGLGEEKKLEVFKNILLGGSDISPKDEEKLSGLKNNIWHTYGMTETITHIALRKISGKDHSDWFTPFEGVELGLTNDKTLKINYNAIGVSNLETNDLAELLPNGNFKILGRKDNVIISGGLKILPEELEKKIQKILKSTFIIYGIPDERLGQKTIMFIENNTQKTDQEILFEINKILPKPQLPKEIIRIKKFDRTLSEKIIRKDYSKKSIFTSKK